MDQSYGILSLVEAGDQPVGATIEDLPDRGDAFSASPGLAFHHQAGRALIQPQMSGSLTFRRSGADLVLHMSPGHDAKQPVTG